MIDVFIAIIIIYCQEWAKKTRDTGYFARSTSESSSVCDHHKCVLLYTFVDLMKDDYSITSYQ